MKKKIFYTFGNHMHWIDMEWMWGTGTLENSTKDMLKLVQKGLKGAINFDAIGYEYLAFKHPETFERLKEAVRQGKIEIAAGTYTQPYPQLIDEESNVQQIIFGVRACERLFKVRPKLFWEEEFYFFPQLPQLLLQAGYEVYCFFFQETWHTPSVPKFEEPTLFWEGADGSKISALSFTDLCVHQWPEDLERTISKHAGKNEDLFLVQWLELMDSPKWMCRSELIEKELERLRQIFEFQPIRPSEIVDVRKPERIVRFKSTDLYHGLSLGKNGDTLRIERRKVENTINDAQILATIAYVNGLSPQWSAYPDWEIEEARRLLMISQAHDIDECEGFCGDIGKVYLQTAKSLATPIVERYMNLFSKNIYGTSQLCVFNPLAWKRKGYVRVEGTDQIVAVEDVPALGVFAVDEQNGSRRIEAWETEEGIKVLWHGAEWTVQANGIVRTESNGKVYELNGLICKGYEVVPLSKPTLKRILSDLIDVRTSVKVGPYECRQSFRFGELNDHLEIEAEIEVIEKPKPGYAGALMVGMDLKEELKELVYDYPFGVERGIPNLKHYRYYPKGDWMTSEKFFEDVVNHFASLRFVELVGENTSMLFLHTGNQGFIRDDSKLLAVLYLYDPWDGENFAKRVRTKYGIALNAKRDPLMMAQEFNRPMIARKIQGSEARSKSFQPFEIVGEIQLSGLYVEGNSLIVRIWNPNDVEISVRMKSKFDFVKIERINLLGEVMEEESTQITLKPLEIKTLRFHLPTHVEKGLDEYRYVWSEYQKRE